MTTEIEKLGGFQNALTSVLPELDKAAQLVRASTSSELFNSSTGEPLSGSGGVHVYVNVADGSDIDRFLRALHDRCWLAGLGWHMIGAGGQLLERALIDRMVGAPERLVFEGPPILIPPVMQDEEARRATVIEGTALDTWLVCPPLDENEQAQVRAIKAASAKKLAPESKRARATFVEKQARQIVERTGKSLSDAARIVEEQCEGKLNPEIILPFDDDALVGRTVADVLADPERFVGETLADPLEGIEYGRGKAKIMRREDGAILIHSFAHGRTIYELAPKKTVSLLQIDSWWRAAETIPPRAFLYGNHYARKNMSASIGAGGRLKTSHTLFEAVEMACGRNLTTRDDLPAGPLRVVHLNGEEDQDELDRRLAAICKYYDVAKEHLGERLFIKSVRNHPLRFATMERGIATLNRQALDSLQQFIEQKKIDVFMLDPWVSFHSVRESDNTDMDLVVKEGLGNIAIATSSAGDISHHPGKPKLGQDTTVEDARGASSIIWAVRSARVFNFMTVAEATRLEFPDDDRRLHVRLSNGKANNAPLGVGNWLKIEVSKLPSGEGVAVSTLWKPPNPFDDITGADAERGEKVAQGGEYRADTQSPDWYGWRLAEELNIRIAYGADNAERDLVKVKTIIKTWLKNKLLKVEERKDDKSKTRKYIVPGPNSRFWKNKPQKPLENDDDTI